MPNVVGEEDNPVVDFEDLLRDPDHPKIDEYVNLVVELLQTMCLFNDFMQKNFWILLSLFAKKPSVGQEVIKVFPIWMAESFDDVNEMCTKGLQAFIVQLIRHCGTDQLPEYWRDFVVSTVMQSARDRKYILARTMAKTLGKLWRSNEIDPLLFNNQLFQVIKTLSMYPDQTTKHIAIPLIIEVTTRIELLRNGQNRANHG